MKPRSRGWGLGLAVLVVVPAPGLHAAPPEKAEPLVLHILRSADSPAEPWLHDTTNWFVGQKKKSLEVVFVDKPRQDAPGQTGNKTSNPVANDPTRAKVDPIAPDLIILEANAEPALYGITLPAGATPLFESQLVIAGRDGGTRQPSLRQLLRPGASGSQLVQPAPESTAGLYALYLESVAAPRTAQDQGALEKRVTFAPLDTLLHDTELGRTRYLLIPDTWCGSLSEKGQKLTARTPREGTLRLRIMGFVPAGLDDRRTKLAQELLAFLAERARTDPPVRCHLARRPQAPALAPSAAALQTLYSDFRKQK